MITPEYQKELLDMHAGYLWGDTAGKYAGDTIVALLRANPDVNTILDYGCGKGTLKSFVEAKGIDRQWTLYDPGVAGFDTPPKGKFDLVITTDVLEHVEEIMLNKVLENLRSLTGRFLYSEIACYFCNAFFQSGPYRGQDLHINLKAPDMWQKRLQHRDFEPLRSTVSLLEGWKVRYLLIQERKDSE